MIRATVLSLLLTACPVAVAALDMPPDARLLYERPSALDSYALPRGPFDGETVPTQVFEGVVERRTWRIDSGSRTLLQLLAPLRDQLVMRGFDILFECRARTCGGFDFRFGTEVVPAPHMHVDIGNFRFLSAVRNGGEAVSLLVSRSASGAYIQQIHVSPGGPGEETDHAAEPPGAAPAPDPPAAMTQEAPEQDGQEGALIDALLSDGHVILDDLEFDTGANALGPGAYESLSRIAAFLVGNPAYRLVLVGHTDSIGVLDANIALSKRRAGTVRDRLVNEYGVPPGRVAAEGMGYLAPVASNLTPEGRESNRRVEALLLPVE